MEAFLHRSRLTYKIIQALGTLAFTALLSACGGEKDEAPTNAVVVPQAAIEKPATRQEAARFLTQATFGPTSNEISRVMSVGYDAWLEQQFSAWPKETYRAYWQRRDQALKADKKAAGVTELSHAFWRNAAMGEDQLRQRVALALSEIFVVSLQDGCGANAPEGVAAYMDMLSQNAFGNYRVLLESVAKHPVMGCYLSHLKNQKADEKTGRVPDENFAREIMQLFSIGLVELNMDGTPKLIGTGPNAVPVETYSSADVSGLAKVFTGWSWDCPAHPSTNCFTWGKDWVSDKSAPSGSRELSYPDGWTRPMRAYPAFHATEAKTFLKTTIPANTSAEASLQLAIKALAEHPNTAPFIAKQLIQRLVTSNPSAAYVRRVATVFATPGNRGDLRATIRAILKDPEARDHEAALTSNQTGKLREPLLRLSALFRAYEARSATSSYLLWHTDDAGTALGQSILSSPSVFNFFRPGYSPPNSAMAREKLVAPEMQLMNETSVAGYVNFIRDGLWNGWGACGYANQCSSNTSAGVPPDVRLRFQADDASPELALARKSDALIEDVNQRLMYGSMPEDLRKQLMAAIDDIKYPTNPTHAQSLQVSRYRVMTAILLTMASPEFLVQK